MHKLQCPTWSNFLNNRNPLKARAMVLLVQHDIIQSIDNTTINKFKLRDKLELVQISS